MMANSLHERIHQSRALLLIAFIIIGTVASPKAQAQAPGWQAVMAATGNYSIVQAVATDASDNVYLTGTFSGTVAFGNYSLTSAGRADVYVVKWNSTSKSFIWAQRAGGTDSDRGEAIAVNGSNIYIAGTFENAAAFGNISLGTGSASSNGAFVAKLTDTGSNGNFVWAQPVGSSTAPSGLAVTGTNVYVTGTFTGTTTRIGSVTLTNSGTGGTFEAFVAKLSDSGSAGSLVWARRAGGVLDEIPHSIAANGTSIYVTGGFSSPSADFGNTTLTNANANMSSAHDVFITKLTDAGNTGSFTWTKQAGGTGNDSGQGIAVNGSNIYVAGSFTSSAFQLGSTTLATSGFGDAFVTKLTDTGTSSNYNWALGAGGPGFEGPTAVAVNGTNVYVTGSFSGATSTFGATTLTNAGAPLGQNNSDFFVTKVSDAGSSGSFTWAQSAGGVGSDNPAGMAVQGANVYVGGLVTPPASFGSQTVTSPSTTYLVGVFASITDNQVLSTKSLAPAIGIEVFPNPAHTAVTVRLGAGPVINQATLILTDALGRVVLNRAITLPINGADIPLDLTGLAPGVYALQVKANSACTVRQLVVE